VMSWGHTLGTQPRFGDPAMTSFAKAIESPEPTSERQFIKDYDSPLWLVIQPSGTKSFQWRGRIDSKSASLAAPLP